MSCDMLLLDIQMGGQDGVSLARTLRLKRDDLAIIFITAIPDFMQDGYDVSALHYLLKPVREDQFFAVLDKTRRQAEQEPPVLLLEAEGERRTRPV